MKSESVSLSVVSNSLRQHPYLSLSLQAYRRGLSGHAPHHWMPRNFTKVKFPWIFQIYFPPFDMQIHFCPFLFLSSSDFHNAKHILVFHPRIVVKIGVSVGRGGWNFIFAILLTFHLSRSSSLSVTFSLGKSCTYLSLFIVEVLHFFCYIHFRIFLLMLLQMSLLS